MPRLCEIYPGICFTSGEKAREDLIQGSRRMPVGKEYTIRIHNLQNYKNIELTEFARIFMFISISLVSLCKYLFRLVKRAVL